MSAMAQNEKESFNPSGKVIMRIFSNFNTTITDGSTTSAFQFERSYFGYQYEFSKELSARVLFDVTVPKEKNQEMTLHVKNAFVKYSRGQFWVNFGMIPTLQVNLQEDFWGYRYLLKSSQDINRMISTADIGMSASYQFIDKVLSADISIINGESYKYIQADNQFKTGLGLTLKPIKDLTIRGVYDFTGIDNAQMSYIAFLGYQFGKNSIGAEYNLQQNVGNIVGKDYWGTSVYITLAPFKNIEVFGRYDYLTSNKITDATENWNVSRDGSLFVAGIEYNPLKGLKITPNYRLSSPAKENTANTHALYMNLEVRF